MKKTDYTKEAENIDFDALSKSWASKTLSNDDEELNYNELTSTYAKNMDAFMELINDGHEQR